MRACGNVSIVQVEGSRVLSDRGAGVRCFEPNVEGMKPAPPDPVINCWYGCVAGRFANRLPDDL